MNKRNKTNEVVIHQIQPKSSLMPSLGLFNLPVVENPPVERTEEMFSGLPLVEEKDKN